MRLYIAVYEARNIARVSERAYLSHQAISKRIGSIESELGTELFIRSRSGLQPTESGTVVYQALKRIVAEFDAMVGSLPGSQHAPQTLRVAVEFYDMAVVNVDQLYQFEKESKSKVVIDVKYCTCDDCYYRLMNNQADAAITNAPAIRGGEFSSYKLVEGEAFILMGTSNPLASKDCLEVEDLERQTSLSILGSDWTNSAIREAFAQAGISPKIEDVSFSIDSLLTVLLSGRGYHIAPRPQAEYFARSAEVKCFEPPISLPPFCLSLILYGKRPLKLYVDEFVEWFLSKREAILRS